jgi:hypothetical protein
MTPSIEISPALTVSKPATQFSRVVLPHPDGPTITHSSPAAISSETPSSASTRAPSGSWTLRTFLIESAPWPGIARALTWCAAKG